MAKRVLHEPYTFNPATRTVTISNRIVQREGLLLVTDVSSNTVLFNFADPNLRTTAYTVPYSSNGTQFVLQFNTSSLATSTPLLILIDDQEDRIRPADSMEDATNKMRVVNPQSLIDTDFEYGLQPIKWESVVLAQNIPAYYYRGGANSLPITALSGGNQSPLSEVTVTTAEAHGLVTSDVVNVISTENYLAEGVFVIARVPSTTQLTYTSNGVINGNILNSSTAILGGSTFDINNIPIRIPHAEITTDNGAGSPGSVITVNTVGRHGLLRGTPLLVNSSTTTSANGNYYVFDVPTATSFRYRTPGISTASSSAVINSSNIVIMVRPEANFTHRPSDGGVIINTGNIQEGIQAIRQTRRYFRYQSGKGLQMSTGTKFCPSYDINSITAATSVCTIVTQQSLGLQSGATIVVEGVEVQPGTTNTYNGTFTVNSAVSTSKTLTYVMSGTPTDTSPGGFPQLTVKNWRGSSVRCGMFDAQNGFYFEYDGQRMYTVMRESTRELMGTILATSGSVSVAGTNTRFSKQLTVGDYVVIRGQSYLVTDIASDTALSIAPHYRANTVSGVRMNLTRNTRTPQSDWNIDRFDGTGISGFNLDITKMQMMYIDYTWYGAGFVRFGMRDAYGNVNYCHKVRNNNVNNQAYMRSGNLPARYEVANIGPYTRLLSGTSNTVGATLSSTTTAMVVKDAQYWPDSGQVMLQQGNNVEIISYTSKAQNATIGGWTLSGLTRREFGGSTSNLTFTPASFDGGTGSSQCSINYITCDCAPQISHWGTSVIMDGGFDDDRSIVFSYAKRASVSIANNTSIAVLSIRLAPSVDNSITANFGNREIVNRMQLVPRSLGVSAASSIQVIGVLNTTFPASASQPTFPSNWTTTSVAGSIGAGSLAQVIDHTGNTTIVSGGEQIFSFVTSAGADNYDLGQVRDLGNSILAGDGSVKTPGFPNGPDILTIVLRNTNVGTAVNVSQLRFSWTEAQA